MTQKGKAKTKGPHTLILLIATPPWQATGSAVRVPQRPTHVGEVHRIVSTFKEPFPVELLGMPIGKCDVASLAVNSKSDRGVRAGTSSNKVGSGKNMPTAADKRAKPYLVHDHADVGR